MSEVAATLRRRAPLTQSVGRIGAIFLVAYAVVSIATGRNVALLGNLAQLVPPLAFAGLAWHVATRSRGQVRVFWYLNATHGLLWSAGQVVWTYYDLFRGGVPMVSPTDPIFFASSLPLAAALYGRPDRERPQWLFEIVLLDIILIALFATFAYTYFVTSLAMAAAPESMYAINLTQLLNARNLLLAVWAGRVWWTATHPEWRRVFSLYCGGLSLACVGGFGYDISDLLGGYTSGSPWDLLWMAPYVLLSMSAAHAWDQQLFEAHESAPPLRRLPVVSLFAVALLVLIPVTDEVARRLLGMPSDLQNLRTRIALTMMIPFGIVVVIREFLSRRTLLRAGQDLLAAREQLAEQEKLAAMGRLVSGVAHELNNPLQGVMGYSELLLVGAPAGHERRELEAISQNAQRAAGIVRNLMTFAGRETRPRTWQPINDLVRRAVEQRIPRLRAMGIVVGLDLAADLPPVFADTGRLEQVVINLLENAEAAIEARGDEHDGREDVPLRVPGEIILTTRRPDAGESVEVEVADNGSGVRDEDLARLFEPFFTTRGTRATGLGLSVCYGIVHEHGGVIRARNRHGGGAAFTVELPFASEGPAAQPGRLGEVRSAARALGPPEASALHPPTPRPRRIHALVVDDEESNATLLRRALERAGYDVDTSTVSRRAVTMIEQTPYDVVIADVRMPEIGGPELYARVCQIRPEMARRFIFVTGDIDGEDTRQFLEQTRCGYFLKPFNLDRLTAAVNTLVGRERDTVLRTSFSG